MILVLPSRSSGYGSMAFVALGVFAMNRVSSVYRLWAGNESPARSQDIVSMVVAFMLSAFCSVVYNFQTSTSCSVQRDPTCLLASTCIWGTTANSECTLPKERPHGRQNACTAACEPAAATGARAFENVIQWYQCSVYGRSRIARLPVSQRARQRWVRKSIPPIFIFVLF
eukprot:jgi/Ulvmu1/2734/UM014_0191.1